MSSSYPQLSNLPILNEDNIKLKSIIDSLEKDPRAFDFLVPVDYIAFGLTDYPVIIKKPMDLGTLKSNLKSGKFSSIGEFLDDLQLIWTNCKTYNMEGSEIWKLAQTLEKLSKKLIEKNYKSIISKKENKEIKDINEGKIKKEIRELPLNENDYVNEEPRLFLTLDEKISLTEKVRKLSNEGLAEFVKLIEKECPSAFEDLDNERVQIRVDYLDRRTNSILNELINSYIK